MKTIRRADFGWEQDIRRHVRKAFSCVRSKNRPQPSGDRKESDMEKQELEHFRTILNDLLEELIHQSDQAISSLMGDQGREIEALADTSLHMNQAVTLRLRSRESRLIRKIRGALERIEDGTYGYCETCGEPISIRRLLARPVTSKCIECKEMEEQFEALIVER